LPASVPKNPIISQKTCMNTAMLLTGLFVFAARILDVSMGTVRTIVTVQGRYKLSFLLGAGEVTIWILVINQVIQKVQEFPVLIVFYSLGFASGNVVGILVEQKLAFGPVIIKIFTKNKHSELKALFEELFLDATSFTGEGARGPVTEIYVVCRRRDLENIIPRVLKIDPDSFYVIEQVRDVNRVLRPVKIPVTGWRAPLKKK